MQAIVSGWWGMITPSQCRAARALLDWSQDTLAERAHLHRATINNFERTGHRLGLNNAEAIETVLRAAGLELLSADDGKGVGVRFAADRVEVMQISKSSTGDFKLHLLCDSRAYLCTVPSTFSLDLRAQEPAKRRRTRSMLSPAAIETITTLARRRVALDPATAKFTLDSSELAEMSEDASKV